MESGRHRERVSLLGRGAFSSLHEIGRTSKGTRVERTYTSGSSRNAYADGAASSMPDPHREIRRKRARRAAMRYVFVWSVVAALALIAQVIAPAAAT